MEYFETVGLNFWEILGLAILFIWAVNRFFRKMNEADDERAVMFPEVMYQERPMNQGLDESFDPIKYMEETFDRIHEDINDDLAERERKYCLTGRFD
jgi:hypothetical protein